jgi:long-chain acyl-CoA synthetase
VSGLTLGSPEQWAEVDPDAPAIVDGELTLTYGEWNEQANRLASSLVDAGFGSGSAIGVRTRIRHQWFVVNRAIGKIGGQQIAVNWRLTPQEVRHILADAGAAALFFDDDDPRPLADGLADVGLTLLATIGQPASTTFDRFEHLVAAGEPTPRQGAMIVPPVVYTSGTTGKPKGVAVENHVAADRDVLRAYYRSVRETPPTPPRSRFLSTMPLHRRLRVPARTLRRRERAADDRSSSHQPVGCRTHHAAPYAVAPA